MSLPIKPQPDCASAWRAAVAAVDQLPGDSAYNVLIDIVDPLAGAGIGDSRVAVVDAFLQPFGKSVETVANTIFPSASTTATARQPFSAHSAIACFPRYARMLDGPAIISSG